MDDAGVGRRAAHTQDDQADLGGQLAQRQQQHDDAQGHEHKAHPRQLGVVEALSDEAVGGAPHGDADVEQACAGGGGFRVQLVVVHQEGRRPQSGGGFQRAVAEEGHHDLLCPGQADEFGDGHGADFLACGGRQGGAALPQGQGEEDQRGQPHLDQPHRAVAQRPVGGAARQCPAHDARPDGGAYAPHAVQPAHVPGGIVQRHIVVQCGVHAACAQAIGDGKEQQHPVLAGGGESQQRQGRQPHGERRHPACTQTEGQPVAHQGGDHRAHGNGECHDARVGQGHLHLLMHDGPGRAQQGVRQTQADKGRVDDGKEQGNHRDSSQRL